MKKILVLGASATQVPLILCAKKMGHMVYVASIPGDYPGFEIADKAVYINTTDKEALLDVCRKEKMDAVCTTGTDVAVRSIGYINSHLGLNGISEESSYLVTDKAKMKMAMAESAVRTAEFRVVYSLDEAYAAAEEIGYPVMLKTVDQAASKGVSKVTSQEEVAQAYENSRKWTKAEYIIVEKCLVGEEIGLDGYVNEQGYVQLFLHNKVTFFNGKTNVPVGHSVPFKNKDQDLQNDICAVSERCVHAMNLKSSFFNMDLMLCNNKAYVLEIGGRTGSTCIPEMLSQYCGFDYYEKIIKNALGEPIDMTYLPQCACAAGFLRGEREGVLASIEKPTLAEGVSYELDVSIGDKVSVFSLGSDRIGQIVCVSADLESAENLFFESHDAILRGFVFE